MSEDKFKWEITIDIMMIIGKYLQSNQDFINIMKLNKKYKELVLMYRMNPISDHEIFLNIQTQHFYNKYDVMNKKQGLFQYIHWYLVKYEDIKNKLDNNIYKIIEFNSNENIENYKENNIYKIPDNISKLGKNLSSDIFKGF